MNLGQRIIISASIIFIGIMGLFVFDGPKLITATLYDILGSRNIEAPPVSSPDIYTPEPDPWTITQKVRQAQEILKISPNLRFEEERRSVLKRKEIVLAILDVKTGNILVRRYWLDEEEIKKANSVRRAYAPNPVNLPKFISSDGHDDFLVVVNWWNNHNSDLSVIKSVLKGNEIIINKDPSRYIVVANKFLMPNDSLPYPEDRTGAEYSDIVYTPYSKVLINNNSVEGGIGFLGVIVDQAFYELRSAGVQSESFPGDLVVDTITPNFMKNLVLTEQTDPKLILTSDDGGLELAKRVLVRLDTNRERTFRFTISKTGASGPAQIMPRTYNSIVRAYPSAGLTEDTDVGRVDMINAIKASILVFDDHLATVIRRVNRSAAARAIFNKKTNSELGEIRAAIYNGGSSKYVTATGEISTRVRETVEFVKKFKMIRALEIFE